MFNMDIERISREVSEIKNVNSNLKPVIEFFKDYYLVNSESLKRMNKAELPKLSSTYKVQIGYIDRNEIFVDLLGNGENSYCYVFSCLPNQSNYSLVFAKWIDDEDYALSVPVYNLTILCQNLVKEFNKIFGDRHGVLVEIKKGMKYSDDGKEIIEPDINFILNHSLNSLF